MSQLIILLLIIFIICADSFLILNNKKCNNNNPLYFNKGDNDKGDNDNNNNGNGIGGVFKSILRFIPGVSKAKVEKSYETNEVDAGNRFMIRLLQPKTSDRRHIITRIQRFFPDIVWETAEDIVDTALVNGIALIRVVNSRSEAEYLVDMLRKADPPIFVEVFDNRKNEVIDI